MISIGSKINDRYEIVSLIGEGGMANVYLGIDTILNRKVAVKILRGDLANDEKFVRRFQREALSASSLSHPNIVEMYDVGEDDNNFYIVMEYVEGKNLKQLLKKRKNLNVNEVIDIMLQLTDGIAHAHDSYIIHRDIKPQNILILDNNLIKITDFGIAMALNAAQLTQTNSVMGSVHYLPPEQATGKASTIKSDIYSLGILMYELLAGELPFRGENAVEIAIKHLKESIPSIKKENKNISQNIENIILKACAKNPKNRYNDCREMYTDLSNALGKEEEQRVVYKFKEDDLEETKIMKKLEVENKPEIKEVKEDEYKPKNKLLMFLILSIGVIFVGLLILFILIPKLTKIPDIEIPSVRNKTVVQAEKILKDLGFEVDIEVEKIYSDNIEEGLIVRTSPIEGRIVKKGTIIKLFESLGTQRIEITDYTDKNIYETKAKLELLGLVVDILAKDVDDIEEYKDKEDLVIDQSVKEGFLNPEDQIILYYPNVVVYPDMIGWNIQEVQDFAYKYDINLLVFESDSELEEGTVLSQSRREGTIVVRGADFSVNIAVRTVVEEEEIDEESDS